MWSKVGAVLWRWLEWLGRNGEYGWIVRQAEEDAWIREVAALMAEGRRLTGEQERELIERIGIRQAEFEALFRGLLAMAGRG